MLHQSALMSHRISELEAQLEEVTKRKRRKRKRIQTGGVLTFGEGVSLAAAATSGTSNRTKKTRGGDGGEQAQPSQRRCRNCGAVGHNARTCQKDTATSSESNNIVSYDN
jgi:hypothetical protein